MGTTANTPLTPAPITSIQPGGGLCMSLELFWGRCRRALLRTFFPGYVRRMAPLLQGNRAGCPHPIIDSRDLKFYRNVCTCSFPPEVDAFAWRGRLGLARAGLAELVVFSLLLLGLAGVTIGLGWWVHPLWLGLLPVWLLLWVFVVSFFRDPERTIPTEEDALVSPADGTVTHVEQVADPDFPDGQAFRISIFLSVFNVHVNRIPRSGKVARLHYYPGAYLDARNSACAVRNEQFWIDLTDARSGSLIRVKQIAGAIARRIVCWLRPEEEVQVGSRLGMIKFGSRTDVLLAPAKVGTVLVKVGDKVKGGSTVLLRLRACDQLR